eukprot:TRINITY_DN6245_c0_g1_i1.p1 TRINITY_DN6245_c0_g1~~TRINITY_DN6245_c0_g1_i1.p1  ORF type:complete len:302 (+),score=21.72 TRINITY_DN6245_c0_g1_i1:123-1028(+)
MEGPFIPFPFAEQADILRSVQKDDFYLRKVNGDLFDVVRQIAGPRFAMTHKPEVSLTADFLYYVLTTAVGRQTLGEEYCDILQVDATDHVPSGAYQRIAFILWHVLIPYLYSALVRKLRSMANPPPQPLGRSRTSRLQLSDKNRQRLKASLPYAIDFVSILNRVHVAFFYFSGVFYHISRRIVNQRYVYMHPKQSQQPTYGILGFLIFLQLSISLVLFLKKLLLASSTTVAVDVEKDKSEGFVKTKNTCSLCLNKLVNPTATICGHLYCWHCINEWCNTKPECPLCRTPQERNKLVCVYGI